MQLIGKGSEAYKAAVVGDTTGDLFKDTSSASFNIFIKLMSMLSVLFVSVVIMFDDTIEGIVNSF